ncbi:YkgJ family cysteine cluster protein [Halospeciosus flavus]|uniref:YkgJ family cysteine cluster protein n=1 Tax=Halospeciosus flavus TaxID=3032283 RepID=A0ABD5Z7F8_9EURY|nr:YkgJ family cysteine cluster protein [Halospeciosus flavus]
MEVDCEGCAGCCLDWRPLTADRDAGHERRGERDPLDDVYNLVPLTRDDVHAFLDAGLADAMRPRLWKPAARDDAVTIDGHEVAAIGDRPVFFVGLRKPPKPVGPFGVEETWLPTCAFLDPETLQCRVHESETYPDECADYPGHNLVLDAETECERVEDAFGGERLVEGTPPEDLDAPAFGPQAVGSKVFVYPDPADLDGVVGRLAADDLTTEDRARFVAVAAASAPGTGAVEPNRREEAYERAVSQSSWVGAAAEEWHRLADEGGVDADASLADGVEVARGAPETPGWTVGSDQ